MQLTDRQKLKDLMAEAHVSRRALARKAGWRSHSYMNRLLAGNATTVTPDSAARISAALGVDISVLFVAKVTTDAGHGVSRVGTGSAA